MLSFNHVASIMMKNFEKIVLENTRRTWGDSLDLAPSPINGEWLPKSAVYALVDLMVVIFGRPKGLFKECGRRIQSGLQMIQDELIKLGITDATKEVDLQHSAIWMAGVYLMLLMQFLENKVAVEPTRSEFLEEQEQLLLKSIPSCFELKFRSQCYYLVGAIPQQKQILNKGSEMTTFSGDGYAVKLWSCKFNSQLANALVY